MGILSRLDLENNTNIYDREDSKTSKKLKKYDKDYRNLRQKYKITPSHSNMEPKNSDNHSREEEFNER